MKQPTGHCQCRICGDVKIKLRAEYSKGNGQYVYRDENGKLWHRRKCPSCYLVSSKTYKKKWDAAQVKIKVTARAVPQYECYIAPGTKLRNCQTCNRLSVNYRHCATCLSSKTRGYNTEAMETGV